MSKLFGGLKMSWPAVIVFAICAGVYTGAMGSIPQTDGTSFRDIAISYEWWVIFAFIIATNCNKAWECMLKIFVFFVISQPLVYLVEVLAGQLDANMALYYYRVVWGPATLFTLPGGFIAFFIKKQNALGSIILGLGCTIQAVLGITYVLQMLGNPPCHLLSAIVCFASIAVFLLCIQKDNKRRIIALATVVVALVLLVVFLVLSGRVVI